MADAVAQAAAVPAAEVRRALTLGRRPRRRWHGIALGRGGWTAWRAVRLVVGRPARADAGGGRRADVAVGDRAHGPCGRRVGSSTARASRSIATATTSRVLPHAGRGHGARPRGGGDGARAAGASRRARRGGHRAAPGRPSAALPGDGLALRRAPRPRAPPHEIPLSSFAFDLLHLDGEDLLDAPCATRAAGARRAGPCRAPRGRASWSRTRTRRPAALDAALAGRSRGRDGEGARGAVRGRAARRARLKVKPATRSTSCARRRVGPRPAARMAVQPPPRRARPSRRAAGRCSARRSRGSPTSCWPGRPSGCSRSQTEQRGPRRARAPGAGGGDRLRRHPDLQRATPAGMALRFARVRRYRDDKRADEADTVETVRALHGSRAGRRDPDQGSMTEKGGARGPADGPRATAPPKERRGRDRGALVSCARRGEGGRFAGGPEPARQAM